MKKILVFLIIFLMISGCTKKEETEDPVIESPGTGEEMEEKALGWYSFEGKDLDILLALSDGTGFDWLVVNYSDNLAIGDSSYYVDRSDQPDSTGGSGDWRMHCSVTDDEDAWLILKCARPWEGDGDFQSYLIHQENGQIKEVKRRWDSLFQDFELVYEKTDEDAIMLNLLKSFEYEVDDKDKLVIKIRPIGEKDYLEIWHDDDPDMNHKNMEKKKLTITDKEFVMYSDQKNVYFYGPDGICAKGKISWKDQYFLDIIKTLDTIRYYSGDE
ncbi:MAG: hypothetical protein IKS54_09035 [Erysipelotrichaceae bacterium]|nr:hypothetical protein [Erysipelotrichaceae bacterium]